MPGDPGQPARGVISGAALPCPGQPLLAGQGQRSRCHLSASTTYPRGPAGTDATKEVIDATKEVTVSPEPGPKERENASAPGTYLRPLD